MVSSSDLERLRDSFSGTSGEGIPDSLCRDCADLLEVSDVTLSFFSMADHFVIGAWSADLRTLGEWAFTFQEGPCLEATSLDTYCVADTSRAEATRWPRLAAKAHTIGYRSLAGVPLQLGGKTFGSMSLHHRPRSIPGGKLADAETIAKEVVPLLVERLRRQQRSFDDHTDRATFHQATGMIMRQAGVAAPAAAALLRTYSWVHDRLVSDVAADVVSRRLDVLEN